MNFYYPKAAIVRRQYQISKLSENSLAASCNWFCFSNSIETMKNHEETSSFIMHYFHLFILNSPLYIHFVIYYTNTDPKKQVYFQKIPVRRRPLFVLCSVGCF